MGYAELDVVIKMLDPRLPGLGMPGFQGMEEKRATEDHPELFCPDP